ncbi:unnamed protein product [Musa acuminata subsp. burmannicoides]
MHRSCNRRVSSTNAVCEYRDEAVLQGAGRDDDAGDALEKLKAILCLSTEASDDNRGWILNIIACPFAAAVEACGRNIKLNGSVECSKAEAHLFKMNMPTHQVNLLR